MICFLSAETLERRADSWQYQPLLLDDPVHVRLHDHRLVLWCGLLLHWIRVHVREDWRLALWIPGPSRLVLPDSGHCLDDVSALDNEAHVMYLVTD